MLTKGLPRDRNNGPRPGTGPVDADALISIKFDGSFLVDVLVNRRWNTRSGPLSLRLSFLLLSTSQRSHIWRHGRRTCSEVLDSSCGFEAHCDCHLRTCKLSENKITKKISPLISSSDDSRKPRGWVILAMGGSQLQICSRWMLLLPMSNGFCPTRA